MLLLHRLGWGNGGLAAVHLLMASLLTRLPRCVTIDFEWDNKSSEPLDQSYTTLKLGGSDGSGQWRPFTIVLTGHERLAKDPQHERGSHE